MTRCCASCTTSMGDSDVGDIGPGWEYYLDLLVAATEGTESAEFDQYYPALREQYLALRPGQ